VAANLLPIAAALADLSDTELAALIAATNGVPPVAYGLLIWIEGTCDWELNRRAGYEYELLPPDAAIDPSEDEVSINAAIVMRATFAQDSPAVLSLFDALVDLLTEGDGPSARIRSQTTRAHLSDRLVMDQARLSRLAFEQMRERNHVS